MRASVPSRLRPRAVLAVMAVCATASAAHRLSPPSPGLPPLPPAEDVVTHAKPAMRVFSDKDGLPQNTVAAQTFDREGRLWVGTQEGLGVYDGRSFHRVPLPDGAASAWVTSLAALSDGTVAVGTHSSGLWLVDATRARFDHVDAKSGLGDDGVLVVATDPAGQDLWVGTSHGLSRRTGGTWLQVPASEVPLAGGPVHAITVASSDPPTVWVGGNLGVALLSSGRWRSFVPGENGLPKAHVAHIALDPSDHGRVWVSLRESGLATLDGDQWRVLGTADGLPCGDIGPVVPMPGVLWIGTICGGLARVEAGHVTVIDSRDSELPDDLVRSLLASRPEQGPPSLWVGTETGGVARLSLGGWRSLTARDSSLKSAVYAFGWTHGTPQDPEFDVTWVGTEKGLERYDGRAWSDVEIPGVEAADAYVNAIVDVRTGANAGMWVGTFGGVARLRDGAWTSYREGAGLPSDIVLTLFEATTPAGNLELLAGMRKGFARFDGVRWSVVNDPGAPATEEVTSMVETSTAAGRPVLWVATATAGLFRREEGKWTHVGSHDSPLPSDEVLQVQRVVLDGNRERLFVSTGEAGLAWFDPKGPTATVHWSLLSTKTTPALPDQVVYGVQQDRQLRLYTFTNHGIARLVENHGASRDGDERFRVSVITTEDGLPSNECNSGGSGIDPRGRVWAGTVSGAAVLEATTEADDVAPKRLLLEGTLLYGDPFDLSRRSDLAYDENTLSFELALLSFHRESDTRYRTELVGLEREPSPWTSDSKVRYTSLPAGAYELRAWGRDYAGNVAGPIAVPFRVRPAPWGTWWAMLGYVAAGASLVAFGVRLHESTLKERARELSDRVDARTAELATRNAELGAKNLELDRKNAELLASNERADRIFSAFTDVLPGSVLDDKYRIEERIGAGGFATVFRAHQLSLDRAVAVKIFRPSPGNDSAMALDRFRREGMTACRVTHPNAIQVFDAAISTDGIPYIVMELLEGRTLSAEIRRRGGLSLRRALAIALPVCDALAAAHGAGLVHRDIKPDNIFIGRAAEGEVIKLLDFGIAKLLDADEPGSSNTASTAFIGTPRYMAPERLSSSAYGPESDVYSLGVVLYEMILGRAPWPASADIFALIAQIVAGRVVPMKDLGVPDEVSALVMRALSPDAPRRFTASELVAALLAVREVLPAEALDKVYGRPATDTDAITLTGPASGSADTQVLSVRPAGWPEADTLTPTSAIRPTSAWGVPLRGGVSAPGADKLEKK